MYLLPRLMRKLADHRVSGKGLENGTIQVLATDHCPFFYNGRGSR